jgi:hypothetical protein
MGSHRAIDSLNYSFVSPMQRGTDVEDLLLVLDEIDDVYSTLGLLWRPIASFIVAVAVFVATGFLFVAMPVLTEVLAIGLVSVGLLEMLRQRRLEAQRSESGNHFDVVLKQSR